MIPTWEQLNDAIIQQMNESEKRIGIRKATKSALAFHFGCAGGQSITCYIANKYAKEFAEKFVCITSGRKGGIYLKEDVETGLLQNKPEPNTSTETSTQVESLIHHLHSQIEKKST